MEARMLTASLALLALLVGAVSIGLAPADAQSLASVRLILVYIPGLDVNIIKSYSPYLANNSVVLHVVPEPPYSTYAHLLKIVTGAVNLTKLVPLNETTCVANGAYVPCLALVNQELISSEWGANETVFINVPYVAPSNSTMAMNIYMNISNAYIPPDILTIPVNGSAWWPVLNTSVEIKGVYPTFTLNLTKYNGVGSFNGQTLDTGPIPVNIQAGNLTPGLYYLTFRLIDYNGTHAKILFPGSLISSGWQSGYYGSYHSYVFLPHLIPDRILRELPQEALVWLLNQTALMIRGTYTDATVYNSGYVYLAYVPLFEEYEYLSKYANSTTLGLLKSVLAWGTEALVNATLTNLGGTSTIMFLNPFTKEGGSSLSLPGEILPGVYDLSKAAAYINDLINRGVGFSVEDGLLYVKDPSILGYGEGQLMIVRPAGFTNISALANKTIRLGYIEDFVRSYTHVLYPSPLDALTTVSYLESLTNNLSGRVLELQNNVTVLNNTLTSLMSSCGACNATLMNITHQLDSVNAMLSESREYRDQALALLVTGFAASAALSAILYLHLSSGIVRRGERG
ncbi:MAG: hypothetical protein ABWK00_00565 [Desulfurococcaceae archaeon]